MLLPLGEVKCEAMLKLVSSRLEHLRDVFEVRHHRGPSLLLKVLIVDQPFADSRLLPRQAATLLSQAGARHESLISGRHRQRTLDLTLKIDIWRRKNYLAAAQFPSPALFPATASARRVQIDFPLSGERTENSVAGTEFLRRRCPVG